MIEYALTSCVSDKEEVAVLLRCFGGESAVTWALLGCYIPVPREVPFLLPVNPLTEGF